MKPSISTSTKKLLVTLLAATTIHSALACTAINIKAADNTVIAGRTMEWSYNNMEWTMLFYPKGTTYYITAPEDTKLPKVKLSSKYAVLGVGSQLASDALVEGQNTSGLGMSGNFLPGFSKYQQVTKNDKHYVSAVEFIRFVLSNYATVAEAKAELPKYKVWLPSLANSPEQATMHFIITDKTDANIVVEFVNGQMKIYDKTPGVLTNAPTYDWHLTNIRNYVNLTNEAVKQRSSVTGDITNVSQGGGGVGLPGDYMSQSRFVKATYLTYYADKPKTADEAVNLTTHILDTVDIPQGIVASVAPDGKTYSDYTQWVAIKDLTNNIWYFNDYDHRGSFVKIDINKLAAQSKSISIPLEQIQYPTNDVTASMIK